eukprot:204156_1
MHYEAAAKRLYLETSIYAYASDTIYEREELLKVAQLQKEMATQCAKEQLENEMKWIETEKPFKEEGKKAYDDWQCVVNDENITQQKKNELQIIFQEKRKCCEDRMKSNYPITLQHMRKWYEKISKLFQHPKAKHIYETWKDGIENHPTEISTTYTVREYENALEQYGRIYDEKRIEKPFRIMADLFDKSLEEEKELLHRFFVYQLNVGEGIDNYYRRYARGPSYNTPPVTIIFDVADLNGKISHTI